MPAHRTTSQSFLDTLESVPLISADLELPEEPGVYFVATKRGFIVYIGQSNNMRKRWKDGHHRLLECMRNGAQRIYFQYTAEPKDLEDLYIEQYNPICNQR